MIDKAVTVLVWLVALCPLAVLAVSFDSQESRVVGKVMVDGNPHLIRRHTRWLFGHEELKPSLRECDQWEYDTLSVPELVIQNPQPQEPE